MKYLSLLALLWAASVNADSLKAIECLGYMYIFGFEVSAQYAGLHSTHPSALESVSERAWTSSYKRASETGVKIIEASSELFNENDCKRVLITEAGAQRTASIN